MNIATIIEHYNPDSEDLRTEFYSWEIECEAYRIISKMQYMHEKTAERAMLTVAAHNQLAIRRVKCKSSSNAERLY